MNRPTEELAPAGDNSHQMREAATLFMVANQDIYVDGLTRIISEHPDLKVIACTSPTSDCHGRFAEHPTDVLMVEQSVVQQKLKEMTFDELFAPFMQIRPGLRIIIFGHEMADPFIRFMLHAGAHGFIDSSTSPKLLGIAINEVRDGGYWLGRKSLQELILAASEMDRIVERGIADKIECMQEALTKRESDVLQYVLEGMSTREIAENLCLSEQSIKLHLGHLFKKFEVTNRSQLILMAFKRVCPVNNMIQLFRSSLDRRNIALGRPPLIADPLADMQ
ncbi:hypothetical protein MNBD_GAMMA15-2422 [hydrothermal vent metagenome]|uniref:HTH luxR-type domain-containing protein n=1 Tax=hydrothermal vent metagenome TaxID=652676 RepID=A0A3B0Y8M3_9ZZZZ